MEVAQGMSSNFDQISVPQNSIYIKIVYHKINSNEICLRRHLPMVSFGRDICTLRRKTSRKFGKCEMYRILGPIFSSSGAHISTKRDHL